jgi:hypothetical protein
MKTLKWKAPSRVRILKTVVIYGPLLVLIFSANIFGQPLVILGLMMVPVFQVYADLVDAIFARIRNAGNK